MVEALTTKALLLTVKEFISVWLNQILYYNHVYDSNVYEKVTSFNQVVFVNRNPNFNEYVDTLVKNLFENLLFKPTGIRHLVCVVYDDSKNVVLRKYQINFTEVSDLKHVALDLDIDGPDNSTLINIPELTWSSIYNQLSSGLFYHIQELKRLIVTLEDIFFSIIVDVDSSTNLSVYNWVQLSGNTKTPTAKRSAHLSDVSLQLFNFDLKTDYYTDDDYRQ
jgi:DNA polymerase zeta